MKIILISGKAMSGKDTSAQMIKQKLEKQDKKVLIAHYADLLKYICKTFFDWDGQKDDYGRSLLQYVGTDKIRRKYPDFWVEFIIKILSIFYDEWDYIIIPDTRFPNEIELMNNHFDNITTLRVGRLKFESPLSEEQKQHKSETALDNYNFNYYLWASDLETLENEIDKFIKMLNDKN